MEKNDPVNLSTTKVISDTFFVSSARIGMTILKPIRGILLGRLLGPELYGILSIPVPYVQILTLLSNIGFNAAVVKLLPGYRQEGKPGLARMIYRSAAILTVSLSVIWSVMLFLLAGWIAKDIAHRPDAIGPIRIYALIIPFLAVNGFYAVAFLAMQRGRLKAGLTIAYGLINLLLPIAAVLWRENVTWVLGGFLAAEVIGAVIYAVFFPHSTLARVADKTATLARGMKEVFGFGFLFFFATLGWNLINSVDRIMVKFYLPAEQLAYYAMAALVVTALTIVSSTAGTALIPSLTAALQKGDSDLFRKQIWNTTRLGLLLLVPSGALFFTLSADIYIIALPRYIASAGPLRILVFIGFIDILCRTAWAALVAYGKGGKAAIAYIVAATLNIGLNMALIPRIGIEGAAIATLSSFVVLAVILQMMMHSVSGVRARISDLAWPLLPALIFPALGYACSSMPAWPRIFIVFIAGTIGFLLISLKSKLVRPSDLVRTREILAAKDQSLLRDRAMSVVDLAARIQG